MISRVQHITWTINTGKWWCIPGNRYGRVDPEAANKSWGSYSTLETMLIFSWQYWHSVLGVAWCKFMFFDCNCLLLQFCSISARFLYFLTADNVQLESASFGGCPFKSGMCTDDGIVAKVDSPQTAISGIHIPNERTRQRD